MKKQINPACILIVDDDRVQIAANKAIFENAGYRTLQARTPDEALDCVKYHDFDLLFTDFIMPGSDGIELYLKICEDSTNPCPAILQTAYLNPKVRQAAADAQFHCCLDKNCSTDAVLQEIKTVLAQQADKQSA